MANLIKSNFNDKVVIILQEQWTKQCQTGDLKSIQVFSKKEKCFKENWMSESKQKNTGVREPDKQENNIKYQTYYRNEYNETKTKEKIFADLILDMEESNKYTTAIQGKKNFNNEITFQQINSSLQNSESEEIEDKIIEVLISINCQTSSTEAMIFPETQDHTKIVE